MAEHQRDGRRRVIIEGVAPEIDGGRFPAKRTIGDVVRAEADIFTDGHDSISAMLLFRPEDSTEWQQRRMTALVNDRWFGEFPVSALGRYRFTIHAWVDHWETWRRDLLKRIQANGDTPVDYLIGAEHIDAAAERASQIIDGRADKPWLKDEAAFLRTNSDIEQQRRRATSDALNEAMSRYPDRRFATEYEREPVIVVDPVRARFSYWYEFFPRSTAQEPVRHGTFADCEKRLEYVAGMGFDVVYLPPGHPIGTKFRKG